MKWKCQVRGCTADMLADGEASIRFRTCTLHRREDEVDMNGVPSRYCQQCTRFHPLSEFDGLKHGCRKRLDRHNLRRKRKNASKRELAQNVAASAAHCTTELTTDLIAPSGQTPGAPPTAAVQQPMLPSDTSSYLGDLRETSGATKPSGSGQQSSHDMRKLPRESPICTQDVSVGFNPSDPIPTSTPWLGGPVREEPLSWTQPTPQVSSRYL
mmetsp:Transcript_17512/g.48849  ORF Transcript_17512/g.48849 Transcript_17512/m.48849 type:complete len:212 (+) Transcript_17512:104-739(+)